MVKELARMGILILPQQIYFSRTGSVTILLAEGERLRSKKILPSLGTAVCDKGASVWQFILSSLSIRWDVVDTILIILGDAKFFNKITRGFVQCWDWRFQKVSTSSEHQLRTCRLVVCWDIWTYRCFNFYKQPINLLFWINLNLNCIFILI